jgi:ADP-heptose:LPS heptosyltransferase
MDKILIVRFSSIGDIVLTTPVIRALHQLNPAPQIHYITKARYAETLKNNPYIHKLYTFEKEITEIKTELKAENYSLIVDLHNNLRSRRLKLMLGVESRSFHKLNYRKWLRVRFKYDSLPRLHVVDRYMQTVAPLGAKNDGHGLDYFIHDEDRKALTRLPETFRAGYHAMVVGGAHFTKQIPLKKLIAIAQGSQLPLVLLGGPDDHGKAAEIERALGDKVLNTCGTLSLNESAAMLEKCRKVITSDTGMMHIASAFNKEILSLWGNTIPEFGMYAYMPKGNESRNHIFEIKDLSCRPCSKIGFEQCPKEHFRCMMDIDTASVLTVLNQKEN